MISFVRIALGCLIAASTTVASAKPSDKSSAKVLDVARSFEDGGGYIWEGGSGVPRAIEFDGAMILPAQKKGTYCSGFTFSVVMETAQQRGLLRGKNAEEVRRFQKEWYGIPKEAAETQCALAVENLGIGRHIKKLSDAEPGDFIQLWRINKSGHSVVLVEWIHDKGQVVGFKYRSSQKSTDGIGDRVEYFSDAPGRDGKVLRERTYAARLNEVSIQSAARR